MTQSKPPRNDFYETTQCRGPQGKSPEKRCPELQKPLFSAKAVGGTQSPHVGGPSDSPACRRHPAASASRLLNKQSSYLGREVFRGQRSLHSAHPPAKPGGGQPPPCRQSLEHEAPLLTRDVGRRHEMCTLRISSEPRASERTWGPPFLLSFRHVDSATLVSFCVHIRCGKQQRGTENLGTSGPAPTRV